MGFSNQERINLLTKALAAGVLDANSVSVWYETFFPFRFINEANTVWTELTTLLAYPAGNLTTARSNAATVPTLLQDLSATTAAVRLTEVTGTNGSTWAAHSTYGDTGTAVLKNWMLPQLIPQSSGSPSNGYSIRLFDGDPDAGGTEVSTSEGSTGSGDTKTVGWIWNYANGMLLLSDDFKSSIADPYVMGFRYIGRTAQNIDDDLQILESTVTTVQSSLATAESEIDTLQTEMSTAQTDIDAAEADIDTLQTEMDTAQTDITTLQTEMDAVELSVSALQQSSNGMVVRLVKGG